MMQTDKAHRSPAFFSLAAATCLLLCGVVGHDVQAQGRLSVVGDVKVNQMVERHMEFNSRVKTISGFRVQIASFSGVNSKASSFELRDRFAADYPQVPVYIIFDEPNFKIKVGDFRSRLEAYAFLQQIKDVYKGYVIKDNIYPEPPEQVDYAPDDEQSGD